jgi:hypothetical protein
MRRAPCFIAAAAATAMALAGTASAAPTVTLKARAVPIPGYPNTGLKLGAGAAIKAEYTIKGTEYVGSPPPLEGINFFLPPGTKLHTAGFKTCAKSVLEPAGRGAASCAKASHAGPTGTALGYVSLGGERVHESLSIESFYAPGGGILFFAEGHSPVSIEILSSGHYTHLGGGGGFGPELVAQIPLVASVPGAPYASTETITVQAGSAYGSKRHPTFYGTTPRSCPKGFWPVKSELIFAAVGGLPQQVVPVAYHSPCPKGAHKKGKRR